MSRPGGQSHPLSPPQAPWPRAESAAPARFRLAGARHPRQFFTAGREQVKSRYRLFPQASPFRRIPASRGSGVRPLPPPCGVPRAGGAAAPSERLPAGRRLRCGGRAPAGGCAGVGWARRLFASTRKHQQREGGRIRGGGGGNEIGRPSGPGSRYRPQRPPSCSLPGLARSPPPPPRGSWGRPAGSRCPGATGRARRGGPGAAPPPPGCRSVTGVSAGGGSHDGRGGRAGVRLRFPLRVQAQR